MQTQSVFVQLGAAAFLSLAASGCALADGGAEAENEEEIGSASAAQFDTGTGKDWRLFTVNFSNGMPFFRMLAIAGANVGNYQADTEYWYVDTANLQHLGQKNVSFSHVDGNGTPPSQSGAQQFQVPRLPPWVSFSTDQVSGGYRYDSGDLHLRIGTGGGEITRLTLYQTIPLTQNPTNITPNGTFTVGAGAVKVPSGSAGYYIDSAIP